MTGLRPQNAFASPERKKRLKFKAERERERYRLKKLGIRPTTRKYTRLYFKFSNADKDSIAEWFNERQTQLYITCDDLRKEVMERHGRLFPDQRQPRYSYKWAWKMLNERGIKRDQHLYKAEAWKELESAIKQETDGGAVMYRSDHAHLLKEVYISRGVPDFGERWWVNELAAFYIASPSTVDGRANPSSTAEDDEAARLWLGQFRIDFAELPLQRTYNVDEGALVVRAQFQGKMVVTEVNFIIACNGDGTERLPIYFGFKGDVRSFYGKDFDKITLPGTKGSGHLSAATFQLWLAKFSTYRQQQLAHQSDVLLLLDNCCPHKSAGCIAALDELPSAKYRFFPERMTGVMQPLDLGIIRKLKYETKLRLWDFKVTRGRYPSVPDIVNIMHDVWMNHIPMPTFTRAFYHSLKRTGHYSEY
ncbi:hypothetical protein GGI19_006175 [Coemansia pectinata]|uniref:DDE-1 domain-containing protein n=1 Tax=Coemansia pectinata TaxID=1052879 RepID=A0A9W8GUY8_9FUNG|nr:hypothetical protein GGI19_006175 [Coemansia pectinata]